MNAMPVVFYIYKRVIQLALLKALIARICGDDEGV